VYARNQLAAHVPPHPFEVTLDDNGRAVVIRVQGEVDAATAPRMGEAVMRLLARRRQVILDLHDVDFMDLHGLGVIIRATRQARADGGSFVIARPAQCVRRLVELVHAENDIPTLPHSAEPRDVA
jgi:anti-sigma B factor antagonist